MNRNVIGIGAGSERRGLHPVEVLLGVTAAVAVVGAMVMAARASASAPESDQALERTRAQAKMLDDLFKVAVVDITNRYDGPPAAKVAKTIFAAAEQRHYFKAKLLDVTGSPQNEANVPRDGFEKRAAKAIKEGKTSAGRVREAGGKGNQGGQDIL
jgi:hypothetical protein